MAKFETHIFFELWVDIDSYLKIAQNDPEWLFGDNERRTRLNSRLQELKTFLQQLKLRLSVKKAYYLAAIASSPAEDRLIAYRMFETGFKELHERIVGELEEKVFYLIDDHAELLDPKTPLFGTDVEDTFSKASEDISEAGKCLALSRPTAAVFHLMRAMELAVQNLYSKLGLSASPEREWGKLLSDIGKTIELLPKGKNRDDWSASHSHLYHVKQAFRNDVMHPKQTYTMEEAKEVFDAVKSFMRHLSKLS
jgi:HEPN domain-containing protein